jgi:2-amino-4-hydroxy-6-hydroxymethyldihydropteridine diphosphokinase
VTQTAYIGIGSNLGDKLGNCLQAVELAKGIPGCRLQAQSQFFRTEPFGIEGQDWYVNGVIALGTDVSAPDLLKALLAIEADMGRERKRKWDPRGIDLDILLYGSDVIREPGLKVPHRFMHLRRFVLVPMVELAPDLVHPVLGKTMRQLLEELPEDGQAVMVLGEK